MRALKHLQLLSVVAAYLVILPCAASPADDATSKA